jgi:hypothetical protein
MMKPVVLPGFDDERTKIPFTIPVKGRKPATVHIPRFDYIPEDVFDALMADLEKLDVEQQVIAVANDLTEVDAGNEVTWEPILDDAKRQLAELGVKIVRTMIKGQSQDLVSAPDDAVKEALKPFAAEKPMPLRKRSRSICLAMLKHVVSEQELEWFEALPTGALDELLTTWRNQSTVSLGESAASS